MVNKPKAVGTAAETAVVRFLRTAGFPHAERRALHGAVDLGDVTGTPGIVWEVKGGDAARTASDRKVLEWMAEADVERIHAAAAVGVLVTQRRGVGAGRAGSWWAYLPVGQLAHLTRGPDYVMPATLYHLPVRMLLSDACLMLRHAGYGQPFEEGP